MECLVPVAALTTLLFRDACVAYLESRRPYISPKTYHEYELNIKTLSGTPIEIRSGPMANSIVFLSDFKLQEIDGDLVRAYQKTRRQKCGAHAINHECGFLCLVRKRIGMPLEDYQPLPLPKEERGQALADEQKERLLRMAEANPNWLAAYCFAVMSVNTSAGPKECYTLRLKDVMIVGDPPLPLKSKIRVNPGGAKNVHRIRSIPLNDEALKGAMLALERARSLGATEPDHYLFPFRVNKGNTYNPNKHQTSFKTAWIKLRAAAGLPTFRMYDLRHHAISVMLENPDMSEETAEHIAGHISKRMKKRYSHLRSVAAEEAVQSLMKRPAIKKPAGRAKTETDNGEVAQELLNVLVKLLKR